MINYYYLNKCINFKPLKIKILKFLIIFILTITKSSLIKFLIIYFTIFNYVKIKKRFFINYNYL